MSPAVVPVASGLAKPVAVLVAVASPAAAEVVEDGSPVVVGWPASAEVVADAPLVEVASPAEEVAVAVASPDADVLAAPAAAEVASPAAALVVSEAEAVAVALALAVADASGEAMVVVWEMDRMVFTPEASAPGIPETATATDTAEGMALAAPALG